MRVLVVDDSRSVRMALRSLLEKCGYEVVEARDGADALAIGSEMELDCITMDVQMPGMDGFETTARIRETAWGRRLPIIFVTSMDSLADREKGFALGATEFISKNTATSWREVSLAVDRLIKTEGRFDGFTILVSGKDELQRRPVIECLRAQGGTVIEAESGAATIEAVRNQWRHLDMIIAEWNLTDLRADALCSRIRHNEGHRIIPFIALIEADDRPDVLHFFSSGGTDYVVKPFAKEEFIARVGVHLETRALINELKGNVEELERLSRMRDGFLAITSHDLKSPLGGIIGAAELMLYDKSLTDKQRKWPATILSASKFMLEIINNIVELGRNEASKESLPMDQLSVAPLVNVAVSTLQQQALSKGIFLEEEYTYDRDLVIRGDRNRFHRILNNLLSNAIKFTPVGGAIRVSISKNDNDLLLTVADTGIGIPEAMREHLFDIYSKSSRSGTNGERGTGLGMYITKQLVDQLNGAFELESAEGKGTVVRLSFPLLKSS
ncbi:MAG: response regulator [Deltaproteobacteria bacterium]|nr:response regulator [Deltaproteobacteria bacterium]